MQVSEVRARERLRQAGRKVQPSGWPDFLCERKLPDGSTEFVFVEVKVKGDTVKPNQEAMHEALRRAGLKVRVIDPYSELPRDLSRVNKNRIGVEEIREALSKAMPISALGDSSQEQAV